MRDWPHRPSSVLLFHVSVSYPDMGHRLVHPVWAADAWHARALIQREVDQLSDDSRIVIESVYRVVEPEAPHAA